MRIDGATLDASLAASARDGGVLPSVRAGASGIVATALCTLESNPAGRDAAAIQAVVDHVQVCLAALPDRASRSEELGRRARNVLQQLWPKAARQVPDFTLRAVVNGASPGQPLLKLSGPARLAVVWLNDGGGLGGENVCRSMPRPSTTRSITALLVISRLPLMISRIEYSPILVAWDNAPTLQPRYAPHRALVSRGVRGCRRQSDGHRRTHHRR